MLNTDTVGVGARGVPADVIVLYHLHYFAVLTDDVVRAHMNGIALRVALVGILKPTNGAVNLRSAIGDVNHNPVDGPRARNGAEVDAGGRLKTRGLGIFR